MKFVLALMFCSLWVAESTAQELTPRLFWPAPKGTRVSASTWLFGDDDDFFFGKKEQDPVFALETNLIKRIRPGLWASLDVTYYRGGNQTIDGNPLENKLQNLKLGGTLVVPIHGRHAIKVGYANGVVTRYGNDFDQFLVSYQVVLK